MKVNELKRDQIRIGLRIKSLTRPEEVQGTIDLVDHSRDDFAWVKWDHSAQAYSGFYGTDCECEVVVDEKGNPVYI